MPADHGAAADFGAAAPLPLVSVRIPSYNHAAYIGQALGSVLDDPYPNKEIVIVDDASTDDSDKVIREWTAANVGQVTVSYVRNGSNQGIARTLSRALSLCRGEYVVSLASDDYLLPGGIALRLQYLRDNPDKLAVFADCIVVDRDGKLLADSGLTGLHRANTERFCTPAGIRREFILNWSVPGPVLMIRRQLLDLIGGYDETRVVEDWDFYLRMAAANLIGFAAGKVSAYRVHGNNACMRPERLLLQLEDMQRILLKNLWLFNAADQCRMLGKLARISRDVISLKIRGYYGLRR